MKKIQKRQSRAQLPEEHEPEPERRPVDPEMILRSVAAQILRDPLSSATEKLRAAEIFVRFRLTQPPTVEQLAREEVAAMSTEQLDEVLGYPPLHQRDPREVERELEQRTAKLEAQFEQRVNERVRQLVDVDAVEARIERRAREIAEHGRPLTGL